MTKVKEVQKNNVPKLRFRGFEGVWDNVILENVGDINPSNNLLPNNFIYIDLESVEKGKLKYENKIIKKEAPSRAQRVLQKKDILFQTVRPYQQNNLYFNLDGEYVASTGYAQIRAKQDSMFLYQYLHTQSFLNKVLARCTGSSYPAINSGDIKKIRINIPGVKEQEKIGSFLGSVDAWVENLLVQKEKLEEYKKGVVRKIFSKEVRFEGFEGEWEGRKLGEVIKLQAGNAFKSNLFKKKGIPVIRISNISNENNHMDMSSLVYYDPVDNDENFAIKNNDLLIAMSGATTGKVSVYNLKENAYLNQRVGLFKNLNENILNYGFLTQFIFSNFFYKQLKSVLVAGAQPNISSKDIEGITFFLPKDIKEQEKISSFFGSIDDLIKLKQKEIERVDNYKKSLIQNLFI